MAVGRGFVAMIPAGIVTKAATDNQRVLEKKSSKLAQKVIYFSEAEVLPVCQCFVY